MPSKTFCEYFATDWSGNCNQLTVKNSIYCKKHIKLKCTVCGKQAVHGCSHGTSVICGNPICENEDDCGVHTKIQIKGIKGVSK